MQNVIKSLEDLLDTNENQPSPEWKLKAILNDQCLSYLVYNENTKEAILVDPKQEALPIYRQFQSELSGYLWLSVIDTHTHADHISIASQMAEELKAPLIMHALAPSQRVQVRIARDTTLPSRAAPLQLIATPGHTPDSMTLIWGPFLFGGDTLLIGDTGRDDLPGGDAEAHYHSIQILKKKARPEMIVLPGHDHRGGRASSWATQLQSNPALSQGQEEFVQEASSFDAPAPKLLKVSLRENFK